MKKSRYLLVPALLAITLLGAFYLRSHSQPMEPGQEQANQIAARNKRQGIQGTVSGKVVLKDGTPVRGIKVAALRPRPSSNMRGEGYTFTDENGRYTIRGLMNSNFQVQVDNSGKPFVVGPPRAIALVKGASPIQDVDFVLENGPKITVRVRDAETRKPMAGVNVNATTNINGLPEPVGQTDANGEFVFCSGFLETGIQLDASALKNPKIGPAPGYSFYKRIVLTKVEDATFEALAYHNPYDFAHTTVRGTVTDTEGKPVAHTMVRLVRDQYCKDCNKEARTDDQGKFVLKTQRISQYVNSSGVVLTIDDGKRKQARYISAADTWTPLHIVMKPSYTGTVSGVVVDANGKPQADVSVGASEMFRNPNTPKYGFVQPARGIGRSGKTDAHGRFTITNLYPEAVYQFDFGNGYGNRKDLIYATYPEAEYSGDWLRLHPHEHRNIGKVIVYPAKKAANGSLFAVRDQHTGVKAHQTTAR